DRRRRGRHGHRAATRASVPRRCLASAPHAASTIGCGAPSFHHMLAAPDAIAAKLPHLPESPGVYLWKDADGTVLYVGKAKRLRSRVRSYLASDHRESVKTRALMRLVADVDTIVVPT